LQTQKRIGAAQAKKAMTPPPNHQPQPQPQPQPHPYCTNLRALTNYLAFKSGPGPAFIPTYVVVNFQKGATLLFCLHLMRKFKNYSPQALMYTCAHGSYGLCWILKHLVFPVSLPSFSFKNNS
jgi:hypothetical protein